MSVSGGLSEQEKRYNAIREEAKRMFGDPNPTKIREVTPPPAPAKVPEIVVNPEILIESKEKQPVSILITAYKSQNFIEECLDSIENQTYFKDNNNYEILLGIDACEETLAKVKSIGFKYRNLQVFMMKDNKGPYVTMNTILDLVNYENIIRFDSDDVMKPKMVETIMLYSNDYNVIRFQFDDFKENVNFIIKSSYMRAFGTIFYKKYVIDSAGGYKNWRCSGDFELLRRLSGIIKLKELADSLFYRRDHVESLSNKEETSLGSQLRKKYNKQVRCYNIDEDIKINKVINKYEIINLPSIIIENHEYVDRPIPISIIVTAYNTQNFIEECLDSIENQNYFKNNHYFEVLVGVDACQYTLNKLLTIRHKYRNLRIFMMNNNQGTYVTSNTLLNLVRYENIIRFDSDDIMKPEMIERIVYNLEDYDIIRFGYNMFNNIIGDRCENRFHLPHGVVLYKRKVFELCGGFQDWKCAADTELLERIKQNVKIRELNERLFYRRDHADSLTKGKETNHKSELRNTYKKLLSFTYQFNTVKINPRKNEYREY